MQKIGLIGGLGPESTLDYYRGIIHAFNERGSNYHYPEIIIFSVDLAGYMELFEAGRWDEVTDLLAARVQDLARAGADFAAMACNTTHLVFEQLQERSPLPLLSIVEAARDHASARGLSKPGLLGAKLTMESDLFQRVFQPAGLNIAVPEEAERRLIQQRLFEEIERGIFTDPTRAELLGVVDHLIDRQGVDSVILGCTELPLILDMAEHRVPLLNTTAIHVAAIVRRCLEDA